MENIQKINKWLFVLLCFVLPFPRTVVLWVWVLWAISWLIEGRWLHRANLQWGWRMMPSILLAGWVIWLILSLLWAGPNGHFPEPQISLLVFPLFALFGLNEHYDWKLCAKALIIGSVVSFFMYGIILYEQYPDYPIHHLFSQTLSEALKHRMLYNIILSVAIVPLFELRLHRDKYNQRRKEVSYRVGWWLCLGILLTTIIATGGRANLLSLIILGAVAIVMNIPRYKGWVAVGMIILSLVGCWLVWQLHPRMKQLTLDQVTHVEDHYQDYTMEPRVLIWSVCIEHPQDYIGHGLGSGTILSYLQPKYEAIGRQYFTQEKYKAHSQYLTICMELGLVAMLLFIIGWVLIPTCFPKGLSRRFILYVTLIFGLSMITDDNLSRLEGVIYFCMCLLLADVMAKERNGKPLSD